MSQAKVNHQTVKPTFQRVRLNPFSLRFSGDEQHLEAQFLEYYVNKTIQHIRLALFLGACLYALFGILDALVMPAQKQITWTIRYAVVCPALLGLALASYWKPIQRHIQPLFTLLIVITGGGVIAMIVVAPPVVSHSYYAGIILVFIFGYTFVRVRYVWASLGGWIVVAIYQYAAIVLSPTPALILISNNFFFISANIVGMLACYYIERHARQEFYLMHLLAAEQQKVQAANLELEQRVMERTEQLLKMNKELAHEILERQRSEEARISLARQLKQAEKMEAIGSLASGVAHDLNNILSGLVSYPDLLLYDLPADSPMRETLTAIKRSGENAAAMVQDLLSLARRGVANSEIVNLNRIVEEYIKSPEFGRLCQRHPQVRVQHDLAPGLLNIMASPVHLNKALMNLVANGLEATLVQGDLTIKTANRYVDKPIAGYERIPEGEFVVLEIRDSGVGIASEDLGQLFEPFFSKKRLGRSGTGLGMTVIWATVKDLDGYIDISSVEGQGTVFEIYLPATRTLVPAEIKRLTIDDYVGNERVLVVDDVADQRTIAAGMLGKLGYQVVTVASGEEAIAYVRQQPVDILVLDMIMDPGIDGCETYRRIIAEYPGQKAIIASGFSESERVREVQRLGAGAYIKKPYTLEILGTALRAELARQPAPPMPDSLNF